MTTKKPNLTRLQRILEWRRPAESESEQNFVANFLVPTLTQLGQDVAYDTYGNIACQIGTPVTIFSSHTDTVHTNGGTQKLCYDNALHHIFTDKSEGSNCLGADDGTGIWLMLHMIENQVPGFYIFHRDEEIGGCGSSALVKQFGEKLKQYKHCIAFDRRGTTDIITHQGGRRTASDAFAAALGKHLPKYKASPNGSFTDSKNYTDFVSECTNLSVGYYNQHTSSEYQDVKFAVKLANSLVKVPWHELPAERIPGSNEYQTYDKPVQYSWPLPSTVPTSPYASGKGKKFDNHVSFADLRAWIKSHPDSAAFILFDMGITYDDLIDAESSTQQTYRAARDSQMEFQRPADVREMSVRSETPVHRKTTTPRKPKSATRKPDTQKH